MKLFLAIAAILQLSSSSHVSVKLAYSNPAGVTYVNGFQGQEHPVSYGTAGFSQAQAIQGSSSYQYSSLNDQPNVLRYTAPLQYQSLQYPTSVAAHHVGYTAAQVPAVAAVPFVKHVPTVSNVPITRYEAHHGIIEQQVDLAKPAVSTRKFEVRRPAIQKQFYDIEERVIVRPAGSALVELDEPTSKVQRGPALLSESSHLAVTPSPLTHQFLTQATILSQSPSSPNAIPVVANAPAHGAPIIAAPGVSNIQQSTGDSGKADQDSVVVENPDFRNPQLHGTLFRSSQQLTENQAASRAQESAYQDYLREEYEQTQKQIQQRYEQRGQSAAGAPTPNVFARSNGASLNTIARFASQETSPTVFPSTRTSPEQGRSNQQTLIDLLTARGGVTEVGFGRDGQASVVGDADNVRARILSATPSPDNVNPAGETVSTRRVVISKPVETLQEINVAEPVTKYERTSVHHPTVFKTAHLDHLQVHSSVPVIGKALAPALAQVAVPVYQKTITPASYQYY